MQHLVFFNRGLSRTLGLINKDNFTKGMKINYFSSKTAMLKMFAVFFLNQIYIIHLIFNKDMAKKVDTTKTSVKVYR